MLDYSGSMRQDIHGADIAPGSGTPAKIELLRDAMGEVLAANTDTINAGLGSLFGGRPSGVRWPIAPLDADPSTVDPAIAPGSRTMAEVIEGQLVRQDAAGSTLTVNALVEAAQYFGGRAVLNGGHDPRQPDGHRPDAWDPATGAYAGGSSRAAIRAAYSTAAGDGPNAGHALGAGEPGDFGWCNDRSISGGPNACAGLVTYDCVDKAAGTWSIEGDAGTSDARRTCKYVHPDAWRGATYDSPISQSCQANAIVLISDGEPDPAQRNGSLDALIGAGECEDLSASVFGSAPGTAVDGNCGPEVVAALATTPQDPTLPDSTVRTYTVGFDVEGPGKTYLQRLATDGGGAYFDAEAPGELSAALQSIVDDVAFGAESFAELSIGVDRETFSSDDRAFASLFAPSLRRGWSGNLKGYFLGDDGLVDLDGRPATDADGDFAEGSRSFWSAAPDGDSVEAGGASGKLDPTTRKLYTDAGDGSDHGAALAASAASFIGSGNAEITAADLGLPDGSPARGPVLDWLRAAPMGDPLHSKSVGVDYGDRQVVYVMTNQGLLHAIDADRADRAGRRHRRQRGRVGRRGALRVHAQATAREPARPRLGHDRGGSRLRARRLDHALARGRRRGWRGGRRREPAARARHAPRRHGLPRDRRERPGLAAPGMGRGRREPGLRQARPDVVARRAARGPARHRHRARAGLRRRLRRRSARRARQAPERGRQRRVPRRPGRGPGATLRGSRHDPLDRGGPDRDRRRPRRARRPDLRRRRRRPDLAHRLRRPVGGPAARSPASRTCTRTRRRSRCSRRRASRSCARGRARSCRSRSAPGTAPTRSTPRPGTRCSCCATPTSAKGAPASGAARIDVGDLYDATGDALGSSDPTVVATARTALDAARGWRVDLAAGEKVLARTVSFEGALLATSYRPEEDPSADPCEYADERRFHVLDIATARAADTERGGVAAFGTPRSETLGGTGIPPTPVIVHPKGSGQADSIIDKEVKKTFDKRVERVYWHAR